MITETSRQFHVGGMWEYATWRVDFDSVISEFFDVAPCPHCHSDQIVTHTNPYGSTEHNRQWICPRVVVAENEAGCNTTGVCLDCILEAAKFL